MSLLRSRNKQNGHRPEYFEVISEDKQDFQIQSGFPRAISMQKVMMKSRSRVEQIAAKENEMRRNSMPQNLSLRGKHTPATGRVQGLKGQNPRTARYSKRNDKFNESELKRPTSVPLPQISAANPSRGVVDVNHNQQGFKPLVPTSPESGDSYRLYDLRSKSTKFIDLSPKTGTQTKEFHSFPVDKEDKVRVEHTYSSVDLDPVSCTYLVMLEENPPVSMKLRNHGLSAKSLSLLKNTLENSSNVRELDLECNSLNDVGIEDLGIMLRGNVCIERLNLSCNLFASKGVIAIGHLLESNKTLRTLSLARNKLTDTDAELLCSSMEDTDNNLQSLDLSFNHFTPEAGHTLGRFLSVSRKLEHLDISGNNFRASGARPVFEGLRENHTLKSLDIAFNELSDRGMKMLASMQSLGGALNHLNMSDNFITVKGIKQFMPILEGNDTLTVLKLDNNQIGTNGLIFALKSILEQENYSLSQLHARGVFADQSIMTLCNEIRQFNSKFVLFGVTGNSFNDTNEALAILQIYLRNNKMIAPESPGRTGETNSVED